jgi:hypothetical protein
MTYEIHELALVFPKLPEKEMEELAKDIAKHGLVEAVTLYENKILDGRNRYEGCLQAGVECKFIHLSKEIDPVRYVISKNLVRRHLSDTQRALLAATFANMPEGNPNNSTAQICVVETISQQEAASMFDVSKRQVQKAKRILDSKNEELIKSVKEEKISLNKAEEQLPKKPNVSNISLLKNSGFKMIDGKYVLSPDVSLMETTARRKIEIGGSKSPEDMRYYKLWETYRKNKVRSKVLKLLSKEFSSSEESLIQTTIEMLSADLLRLVESQRQIAKYQKKIG